MDPNNHMTKPGNRGFMIFDPDWLVKIKETDDSEYRTTETELSSDDFGQVWRLSQKPKRKLTWQRWIDFAIGALISSAIWFAILIWVLR